MHCNVVCDLVGVLTGDSQQNANLCRQVLGGLVQVNCNVLALNACNAADNDLLAEQCTSVGGQLLNGLALVGCSLQLFQGGSVSSNSSLEHVWPKAMKGSDFATKSVSELTSIM